jgi:hypothetical protein
MKKIIDAVCIFIIFLGFLPTNNLFAANVMSPDSYSFEITEPPDTASPYTLGHVPAKSAVGVSTDTDIIVHIKDDGAGVDIDSIRMTVNGQVVSPVITGDPSEYILTYDPSEDFQSGQEVFVTIQASDLAL